MMKYSFVLGILLLLPIVSALDYRIECDNTTHLTKYMEFTTCEGSNCTDYNLTQTIECTFGCDNVTDVCRNSEIQEYTEFGLYLVVAIILIGVLALIFKKVI